MTTPTGGVGFVCPHCSGRLEFAISLTNGVREKPMTAMERAERWLEEAPAAVRDYFSENADVFQSFRKAIDGYPATNRPVNVYKFFFTVISRMQVVSVKPTVTARLSQMFPGGHLSVWQANGMVAVVVRDEIKAFVALAALNEMRPTPTMPGAERAAAVEGEWIRTRFGYVTSRVLMGEFQKRTLGAWDTMTGKK